ncbi:hypothetical protein COCVIDRAFT_20058 [Bipolaris victoriae FI3]|nr:hypothetical protein COCVIDRAFT_20058 [Bipolaris victoriae FI3]
MIELEKDHQYAPVASDEELSGRRRRSPFNRSTGCVMISIFLAFFLITGVVVLVYEGQIPPKEDKSHTECGASLADFEANGCEFDVLSYAWMPTRCKDTATSDEFRSWLSDPLRHLGPWPFFTEMSEGSSLARNRIPSEEDFGNRWEMQVWSSVEEHLAHCMFLFLHVSRVAFGEAPRRAIDTYGHAEHCFHAIWKGLNGTWNMKEDKIANQAIEIEVTSC